MTELDGTRAMSTLLVLQHIACEPPAAYEDELRERGVSLHRVKIDEGEPLPDWREFAGSWRWAARWGPTTTTGFRGWPPRSA